MGPSLDGSPRSVAIEDGKIYVSTGPEGLHWWDLADPTQRSEIRVFQAMDHVVSGSHVFVASDGGATRSPASSWCTPGQIPRTRTTSSRGPASAGPAASRGTGTSCTSRPGPGCSPSQGLIIIDVSNRARPSVVFSEGRFVGVF